MKKRKEIKFSLFLLWFLLFPIAMVYAQKDTAKAKKYSVSIAGDVDVERSETLPPILPDMSYALVWGCNGYLIVENNKNTGLEGGLSYGEKEIEIFNYQNWLRADYAMLFLCFRHDTKIIYYGIGLAEELKITERVSADPMSVFSPIEDNIGLMGFLGLKRTIGRRSYIFMQAEFLQDIFPDIHPIVEYPGDNFVNYGLSIGWTYRIN